MVRVSSCAHGVLDFLPTWFGMISWFGMVHFCARRSGQSEPAQQSCRPRRQTTGTPESECIEDMSSGEGSSGSVPASSAASQGGAAVVSSGVVATSSSKECAICFDDIEHTAELPCSCNVDYCARCWDHSLAQSLHCTGRARCPTCRCNVHVDFDADEGRLVFSPDQARDSRRSATIDRLIEQARPAQVKILQQFGKSRGHAVPKCVCGSHLQQVSGRERFIRHYESLGIKRDSPVAQARLEALVDSDSLTCDVCDVECKVGEWPWTVWTCENGYRTIMHSTAYDVCDRCFQFHVSKGAESEEIEISLA